MLQTICCCRWGHSVVLRCGWRRRPDQGCPSPLWWCTGGRWATSGRSWTHESWGLKVYRGTQQWLQCVCMCLYVVWPKVQPWGGTYLIFGFWWRRASDAPWRCFHSHKTRPAPWQGPEGWKLSLKNQQQHKHQEKSHADVCWGSFKVSNTTGYQFLHSMNIHNAVFLIMCLRRFG